MKVNLTIDEKSCLNLKQMHAFYCRWCVLLLLLPRPLTLAAEKATSFQDSNSLHCEAVLRDLSEFTMAEVNDLSATVASEKQLNEKQLEKLRQIRAHYAGLDAVPEQQLDPDLAKDPQQRKNVLHLLRRVWLRADFRRTQEDANKVFQIDNRDLESFLKAKNSGDPDIAIWEELGFRFDRDGAHSPNLLEIYSNFKKAMGKRGVPYPSAEARIF